MTTTAIVASTSKYDQVSITKDAAQNITDILFSGLNVTLSELVDQFPAGGGWTLTIYADTITVDVPQFNADGVILVARQIDISSLDDCSWPMPVPQGKNCSVFECLLMHSISDNTATPLTFATEANPNTVFFTAPTNSASLNVGEFTINPDGSTNICTTTANDVLDLIGRPYALNALYSSFYYATELINAGDPTSINTAITVLQWICAAISGCGAIPQTHAELYAQATALQLTLSVPEGYHFLAPLSIDFYKGEISNLISAVEGYNTTLNQLSTASDLQDVIQTVCTTADTETLPTQTELNQVTTNIQNLYSDVKRLSQAFGTQLKIANNKGQLLSGAIKQAQIDKFLMDSVATAIDAVGAGVAVAMAVAKDGEGAGDAAAKIGETFKQGYDTIKGITESFDQGDLITDAKSLMTSTQTLLNDLFTAQQVWLLISNPATAGSATLNAAAVTMDPNLAWDNFLAQCNAVLANLANSLKESDLSSAQEQANNYLASLQILANFGKAINAQIIAYSKQLCRAMVLKAKLTAIKNAQQVWAQLSANSKSEQEKLSAMGGLVQTRIDACMRSLYIAWTDYSSAYLYNNLAEPEEAISMDSSVGDLEAAFASIQTWVTGLGNGTTQLPNENSRLQLTIPVTNTVTSTGAAGNSNPLGLVAYLTPGDGTNEASITLSIPKEAGQFSDQINLGNGDDVAIWITAAEFYLSGIQANASGYVPLTISTSGKYENGYGTDLLNFVSNAISSNYTYTPATASQSANISVPWSINPAQYMLPTPFTQWTIAISNECDVSNIFQLQIALHVNFLIQNS